MRTGPNKGRKLSEEWKQNLSLSLKGRTRPPFSKEWKRKIGLASKGRVVREETRQQISKTLKGRIMTKEHREKIANALKGRTRSKSHSENISKSLMGLLVLEKNPNWRGGKSFEPYSREWRESLKDAIRKRDFYTCQYCNKPQGKTKLCVHHINYDKFDCREENLISLCVSCHLKTNAKREWWKLYFLNRKEK